MTMTTPILLKSPSVWFFYILPTSRTPGRWINLALVTQVTELLDGKSISVKLLMTNDAVLIFHGSRALSFLEELERMSGIKSQIRSSLNNEEC